MKSITPDTTLLLAAGTICVGAVLLDGWVTQHDKASDRAWRVRLVRNDKRKDGIA